MVLTAYFVLSPVTGLSCHRRLADRSAKLDASVGASGPHDFAVRESIIRPRAYTRLTLPRPSHPALYVRDDRDTPLLMRRDGDSIRLILANREAEYFSRGGWTGKSPGSPSGKSLHRLIELRRDRRISSAMVSTRTVSSVVFDRARSVANIRVVDCVADIGSRASIFLGLGAFNVVLPP
jgi:hypothetical protein